MKTEQRHWTVNKGWVSEPGEAHLKDAQLVLVFGSPPHMQNKNLFDEIRQSYPQSYILGGSSAGEICGTHVHENSLTVTAIFFEHTTLASAHKSIISENSFSVGEELVRSLSREGLRHIFFLADGLNTNGTELIKGMSKHLPKDVTITGGLAGDNGNFIETLIASNNSPESKIIAAIGFYGSRFKIGYGSKSGFAPFGPERIITRSENNVLYELDGEPAFELYRKYLGNKIKDFSTQCFYFPLLYKTKEMNNGVVRTILRFDEKDGSLTFAGDISTGSSARLMKANIDNLVSGAEEAANNCTSQKNENPELAILVSCVGRKIVMKQRVEEEIEIVRDAFSPETTLTGFYSYGEIAPFDDSNFHHLHNQTMSITTISES
jgi:hypothetical protein